MKNISLTLGVWVVIGIFSLVSALEVDIQPLKALNNQVRAPVPRIPNFKEFLAAIEIAKRDEYFGPLLTQGKLLPYRAMPPLIENENRTISLGLRPTEQGLANEIVGIQMRSGQVVRYPNLAPPNSMADHVFCGFKDANQETSDQGLQGQALVTVRDNGQELWKFVIVRPSNSDGTWGSGVEIRDLKYKRALVARRIHAPILNVLYDQNACGPYRDWIFEENPFQADGVDLANGVRKTITPPQTIIESSKDEGNFRGVAVYVENNQVTLVSELQAGWYRYISKYILENNGTIRPIFGFTAVENSCVCKTHHHHVYWRFHFDYLGEGRNHVEVFDGNRWSKITQEEKHQRDATHKRHRVLHSNYLKGYEIIPGESDGVADEFARGDAWVLRYKGNEIDDGNVTQEAEANLDAFLNNEPVDRANLVFWYGGHFTHDVHADHGETHYHLIGPTLKPVN